MIWSWICRLSAIGTFWVNNLSFLSLLSNFKIISLLMFIKICWYRLLSKPRLINWLILIKSSVALAITLTELVLNLKNDIIEKLLVTYRLKEWYLESGNKIGNAHFETSKFRWYAQNEKQQSFSICYPPILGVWFYCFTNSTRCFLRVQFLTPFRGSPYLVLLGVRTTVLCHNLEKYESSKKLSGRPPTVDVITLPIVYRQLRTQKSKNTAIPTLFSWEVWNLWNLETFAKNLNFPQFWNILRIRVGNPLSKDYHKIPTFAKSVERNYKQHIDTYWNYQANC